MIFALIAALIVIAVCATIINVMRNTDATQAGAQEDVQVYRDQLQEVDRDVARGVLTPEAAERTRLEISRRLLDADKKAGLSHGTGPRMLGMGLTCGLVALITGITYWQIGAPGYPDLPLKSRIAQIEEARAARPAQAEAEAQVALRPAPIIDNPEVEALVVQLRDILQNRPDDLRGHELLVRHEAGLGNMNAAWNAQHKVINIRGAEAGPDDYATLAELKVLAAGGYVSPEAEAALAQALERDPRNGTARYYYGLMYAQSGRPDLAWPIWRRLMADSTPDAPWLEPIRLQIEEVSALAGDPTPLDQLPVGVSEGNGPSAEDIEAASAMSMEERMSMIQGMVQGLGDRLAAEGGPPQDWARLITALGVLGNTDAAAAVYAEAVSVFGEDPGAMDILNDAGDRAGVNP